MYGLLERDLDYIMKAAGDFPEIERVMIFGSRALGNYKKGSDVDIAVFGKKVNSETLGGIEELLNEEYPIPYFFDILHYEGISNEKLKSHIDTYGKEIYRQNK